MKILYTVYVLYKLKYVRICKINALQNQIIYYYNIVKTLIIAINSYALTSLAMHMQPVIAINHPLINKQT